MSLSHYYIVALIKRISYIYNEYNTFIDYLSTKLFQMVGEKHDPNISRKQGITLTNQGFNLL